MTSGEQRDVGEIMLDRHLIQRALRQAWARALIRHKLLGNPIVVWRDGKVVWIPAEEIEVPEANPVARP